MKTNQMWKLTMGAAVAAVLTVPMAMAQPPAERGGMRGLDTNRDGKVTLEEAQAARPGLTEEDFNRRDKDGDGVWTVEDRKDRGDRPGPEGRRGQGGPDGKGGPHHGPEGRRGQGGPDGKGGPHHGPEGRRGQGGPDGKGGPHHGPDGRRGPGGQGDRPNPDADGNGEVTLEEFRAVHPTAEEMFERLDRNGDGVLTGDELPRGPHGPGGPGGQRGPRGPRGPHGPGGADGRPEGPPRGDSN